MSLNRLNETKLATIAILTCWAFFGDSVVLNSGTDVNAYDAINHISSSNKFCIAVY
jgi:hypothetical protein